MIYLDNAATTKICEKAVKAMEPYLKEEYGNPSGIYSIGRKTREQVEKVRWIIAKSLNCKPENIFFTSGGTESDNWVLDNGAYLGNHIITSKIEHHAILNKCKQLENEGIKVTYVDVDKNGFVDMEQIKTDYKDGFENPVRTSLVSIMLANNEIGTIEPIRNIAMVAHRKGALFHTDAVQAFGHIPIDVNYLGVDMLSASSHKFNGPKGVGFLYVRNPKEMMPLIYGGGQEKGKRGGTENVAGIIGMGAAVEDFMRNMSARYNKEKNLRDYMVKRILGEIPNVSLNGHYANRLPGNASFTFDGINGTSLVVIMDEEGVCISAGSACAASAEKPSHVISALGIPKEKAYGTIRITIGHENTRKEIDYTVEKLKAGVKELRAKS